MMVAERGEAKQRANGEPRARRRRSAATEALGGCQPASQTYVGYHPTTSMFSSLAAACGRGAAALLATPFQVRWKGGPGGIHKATRMTVIDNSGAKKIKVIDYFGRSPATLGSAVRASVKEAKPDGRVSRKEIVAAVVVRQRAVHTRKDGTTVRFQENAAQHRESAPLAAPPSRPTHPQGAPGGSGRRALARGRAGSPGAPPLPRVRELAASIAAHFPAF
jgi:hypothetical protein